MKWLVLSTTLSTAVVAFAPAQQRSSSTTSALYSTAEPPARQAPGAGWKPEWEDRPGLPQEEFLASDMNQPDLSGMWECPLPKWDSEG